ncbi:MAG: SdpI family protein [Eubacteriales bacterium]|nr:SdpI family protein [Eubacteriales bacterium]
MRKTSKAMIWITAVLPLILAGLSWSRLPDTIPLHWGLHGEVNRWAGRNVIFLLAAIALIFTIVLLFAAKIDPKARNINRRRNLYEGLIVLLNLMLLGMMGITIAEAIRPGTVNVGQAVTLVVGILFAAIGNYLPKMKQNFTIGVRTPWALADEANWQYSNRFGGYMMFFAGLMMILGAFLLDDIWRFALILILVIAWVIGTFFVSYWYYRTNKTE